MLVRHGDQVERFGEPGRNRGHQPNIRRFKDIKNKESGAVFLLDVEPCIVIAAGIEEEILGRLLG